MQILMTTEKIRMTPKRWNHLTGAICTCGWQTLTNLSRDTRTVVKMEMVRLIWVRGRRKGRRWGKT